jgi:hypothetical protein
MPRKREVKVYTVSDRKQDADFSKAEIEALIYKIALWYSSPECDRKAADPAKEAKDRVTESLLALTKEGKPWMGAPQKFEDRIRAKCSYDMATNKGIPGKTVKNRGRNVTPEAKQGVAEVKAKDIIAANFDQDKFRRKTENDILAEYPELDNSAHRPMVRRLSLLYAQQEIVDMTLAFNPSSDAKRESLLKQLKELEAMSQNTMKSLGIHPDQLAKAMKEKAGGTISDLVAMLEDDQEFVDRERKWSLQLALQLWWMVNHPDGKGTAPQLSEWEMWHFTRTRPVKFTCSCGRYHNLVEGFKPDELRDYLLSEGVLLEVPVIKGLIPEYVLTGLGGQSWRTDGDDVVWEEPNGEVKEEG